MRAIIKIFAIVLVIMVLIAAFLKVLKGQDKVANKVSELNVLMEVVKEKQKSIVADESVVQKVQTTLKDFQEIINIEKSQKRRTKSTPPETQNIYDVDVEQKPKLKEDELAIQKQRPIKKTISIKKTINDINKKTEIKQVIAEQGEEDQVVYVEKEDEGKSIRRFYYDTGEIEEEEVLKNGIVVISTTYTKEGVKSDVTEYEDCKKPDCNFSKITNFDKNGLKISEMSYEKGKKQKQRFFIENEPGYLDRIYKSEMSYSDIIYDKNGNKYAIKIVEDGIERSNKLVNQEEEIKVTTDDKKIERELQKNNRTLEKAVE